MNNTKYGLWRYQIFKTILKTTDPFPRHDFSPEFTLACIITLFGFSWISASRHSGSLSSLESMINIRSWISRISQYRPLKLKAEGQPTFSRHTYVGSIWSRHLEGERESKGERERERARESGNLDGFEYIRHYFGSI